MQQLSLDLDMAQSQDFLSAFPDRGTSEPASAWRPLDGLASLCAGTALGLALTGLMPRNAMAQSAEPQPIQLPPVSVEGAQGNGAPYKVDDSTLSKLTGPLRDTGQSITVIPQQYLEDRGVTNINDALRSVPGVSLAAGEAGAQGNSLTLRGFTARNDIFLDGMRDFGSYYRDPFDFDEIEVLKGPSSILFGRGSTGGVINQESKLPTLTPLIAGSGALGTDNTKRATVDVNEPVPDLGEGAALRLNAMVHDSQVADRDVGEYRRYGVAPSFALGLGTPTRLTVSYFHESEDDTPDYGIPFLLGHPAPVDRSNYYGFENGNFLKTDVDIGTVKLEHDFNDAITVRDQFRYAQYDRDLRITEAQIPATVTAATPLSAIMVTRNQIALKSEESFLDNQTDATFRFRTGPIGHAIVAGIEASRETSDPTRFTYSGVPTTPLLDPNPGQAFAGTPTVTSRVTTASDSIAFYALDTLKFGEQWELTGGIRWDRFDTHFSQAVAPTASFSRIDEMPSYRASLVYKPLPNGSTYFSYGTSFNPSAETLSLSAANANLPPEENETYEVGTKWDLLDDKLSLRSAIYRTDKTNARETDPNNPLLNVLGGEQQVDGIEIEGAGRLTDRWQIFSGYSYMHGEVVSTEGAATAARAGSPLNNVPKHTFNLWTTYELPWKVQLGGGVNYVATRVARNTVTATSPFVETVPDYWTIDLSAKYHLTENVDLQVNIYNLTDKNYIDQVHPAHIVPGAGRWALFSTNFKF